MHTIDKIYIDGAFVSPHGRDTLALYSPVTNAQTAAVVLGDAQDAHRAVAAARRAFQTFSQTTPAERIALLERIHAVFSAGLQSLVDVMVEEYGGTAGFCRMILQAGVDDFQQMAHLLRDFDFAPRAGQSTVRLQGVGVVGVIIPWNASNGFICTKVASAIGAGCTTVIKPSEMSARQTQLVAELFHAAGVPPGVVNFVNGSGAVVGAELTRHPGVAKISFTGSTTVGKTIARDAADTMKRVTLELGGKSPNILLDDVDFADAVPKAVFAAYLNSGQACAAATRLLVPADRLAEVNAIVQRTVAGIKVGLPHEADTAIGPMVSRKQYARVQEYIRAGIEEGATLLTGGPGQPAGLEAGNFVQATVFTDVRNSMRIAQEEIFGPVLAIIPYRDEADAVAIANDTPYGLCAYVSSADRARAVRVAARIDAGRVCINNVLHDPLAPFGGFKQSGIGREYGVFGLQAYLEPKAVIG